MAATKIAAAVVLALVGAVWIGQGIGVIPGSFMTSDLRWAGAGIVLLVVAAVLLRSSRGRDDP